MDHINIFDFQVCHSISGIYRINNILIRQVRNGNTYLKATLSDATGNINMVFWEYDGVTFDPALELAYVVGTVETYQGTPPV